MRFTSLPFFLFLFVLLGIYYLLPRVTKRNLQWMLLLLASLLFYISLGIEYLPFLLLTSFSAYFLARIMEEKREKREAELKRRKDTLSKEERRAEKARLKKKLRLFLVFGLVLNFGVLAVLKYLGALLSGIGNFAALFGAPPFPVLRLLLPIGISFYTFQTMGYLIDVYWGRIRAERNPCKLLLFTSFFPQLMQGPISRYSDLASDLYSVHHFSGETVAKGARRFLYGLFKKLVIADRSLIAVKTLLSDPEQYTGGYVLLLIVLYSLSIYADFTGGIDMTLGIGEAFGIRMPENFQRPFSSKSTEEYWKRWHMTLGTWFETYVFYPLAVAEPMLKLSKKTRERFGVGAGKRISVYLATLLTWALTGIWHGAGANFLVWGLLNCLVILVSQELKPLYSAFHARFPSLSPGGCYGKWMAVRTFFLMGAIRIFDCYGNVPRTFFQLGSIFTGRGYRELFGGGLLSLGLNGFEIAILIFGAMLFFLVSKLEEKKGRVGDLLLKHPYLAILVDTGALLLILMLGTYGIGYDESLFIYTQF